MKDRRFDIILAEQLNQLLDDAGNEIPRELQIKSLPRKATIVTGIRRSGKSTYLRQHLRKSDSKPPLYLSFFDERLIDISVQELNDALVAYGELHDGIAPTQFLFDEIQMVNGWERFISRLLEDKKNEVFITGSSAKLLSKEISTSMRGRSLSYELFPFSWTEFLQYQNIDFKKLTSSKLGKLNKALTEYLVWGSFPELIKADLLEKQLIVKEYFEVLLFRDLIERNQFGQVLIARKLLVSLIRMYGNRLTINQTHKKLRAEGIVIDKGILSDFIRWCEDAYILFSIRILTTSEHRARTNPSKIYICDSGLAQACETWDSQNLGRRFENACFLQIRARQDFSSIHYYMTKSGKEVDFIFENLNGKRKAIQICWELSEEARERELTGLQDCMKELKLDEGFIITANSSELIKVDAGKIHVLTFDQFFRLRKG
jgi:predicted AAA+ superfamily ATPase